MNVNKNGIKVTILAMSLLQMATNAVASVLAQIASDLQVSDSAAQYLMTFPCLIFMIMSFVTPKLATILSKKKLALTGLILSGAAGILSFLFHGSIVPLFIWDALLGFGIGLTVPVANALIIDYYEGEERASLLGWQTSAANIGSMAMTFVGGYLALLGWHFVYFVYLLAIPGIICILLFLPRKNVEALAPETAENTKKAAGKGIPKTAYLYFLIAFLYMLMFYVGPTNLAMVVQERQIGSTAMAGNAATVLLLGGVVMGLFFGKVAARIGRMTIPVGFLMLVIGFLSIYFVNNVAVLFLGAFLIGTSNTLILPQCMGSVTTEDKGQSSINMGICLGLANLGIFAAPIVTGISAAVMGNSLSTSRFLFAGIVSLILAVLSLIVLKAAKQ